MPLRPNTMLKANFMLRAVASIVCVCFVASIASADVNTDGEWQEIPRLENQDKSKSESSESQKNSNELQKNIDESSARTGFSAMNVAAPIVPANKMLEIATDELSQALKPLVAAPAEPVIIDYGSKGSGSENEQSDGADAANADTVANLDLPEKNIDMFVGQLLMLGKVDVNRVAIGNGEIVRVEILKTNELLVIGQNEGSTSLRLWNTDNTQTAYNIRIGAKDPETRVHMERMVRMRVRMVEFNRRAIGKLGVDWGENGVASGPTFATAGDALGNSLFRPQADGFGNLPNQVAPFSTYFGIATNVTSKINFLSGNGDAVTLAEPVLSAVNGGHASFLAGGQIPYPTRGESGESTVEFKEYGVRLHVAPSIDAGDNIRTLVETEISKVDTAVSINGTPGLLTRRAQTEVNVRSGETIVLAGLLSSDDSEDVAGIPGLRKLPLIGRFFSTKSKTREARELVIFITPEVVDPENLVSPTNQQHYEQSTRRLETVRQSLPLME